MTTIEEAKAVSRLPHDNIPLGLLREYDRETIVRASADGLGTGSLRVGIGSVRSIVQRLRAVAAVLVSGSRVRIRATETNTCSS